MGPAVGSKNTQELSTNISICCCPTVSQHLQPGVCTMTRQSITAAELLTRVLKGGAAVLILLCNPRQLLTTLVLCWYLAVNLQHA
jgi:hypothetical protein